MNETLKYARAETLRPSESWSGTSQAQREDRIREVLANDEAFRNQIDFVSASADGEVIINLRVSLPADHRGTLLLNLEACLKETVDCGLTVWLDALGDRNSLRNLRGIEVKAS